MSGSRSTPPGRRALSAAVVSTLGAGVALWRLWHGSSSSGVSVIPRVSLAGLTADSGATAVAHVTVRQATSPTPIPYPLADIVTTYWVVSETRTGSCASNSLTVRGTAPAPGRPGVTLLPFHALSVDGHACDVAPAGSIPPGTALGALLSSRAPLLSGASAASSRMEDLSPLLAANPEAVRIVQGLHFLDVHVAIARDSSLWCPPLAVTPIYPRRTVLIFAALGPNDTVSATKLGVHLGPGDRVVWVVDPAERHCVYARSSADAGRLAPTPGRAPPAGGLLSVDVPPSPSPVPDWGYQCFPARAPVTVRGRGMVAMEDVTIGDALRCGKCDEGWSTVYASAHAEARGDHEFVRLVAAFAENEGTLYDVTLSGGHYIAVGDRWVRADAVVAGDMLTGIDSMAATSAADAANATCLASPAVLSTPLTVTDVTRVRRRGLYAPLTMAGEFSAGPAGVRVSAYAVHPTVGAAATAPLRALYAATGIALPLAAVGGGGKQAAAAVMEGWRRVWGVGWGGYHRASSGVENVHGARLGGRAVVGPNRG